MLENHIFYTRLRHNSKGGEHFEFQIKKVSFLFVISVESNGCALLDLYSVNRTANMYIGQTGMSPHLQSNF